VQGRFAAFRSSLPCERQDVHYELVDDAAITELADVQWADWDAKGRLLVATTDGRLQVRAWSRAGCATRSEVDLRAFAPSPSPPPKEAYRW
jgi:hypothetical protein